MSRTTETLTISMPSAFRRKLDRVCKQERRSRSDVVRDALQAYFAVRRVPQLELGNIRVTADITAPR